MHGEDRPNIKTELIIGALKFAEFPDHISIDYGQMFCLFWRGFFYSGEITFKLHEKWDENLLNENSATYKILEGNVKKAVSACLL